MRRWVMAVGMSMALVARLPAESLFKEGFEDGDREAWVLTSGGAASVADDAAGIGSGKALFLSVNAGSTQRRLVAGFPAVELSNPGDGIALRFDFRVPGNPSAPRGTGDALGGFRFGLFDSKGTPQTRDATSGSSSANAADDAGYLAMVSVGAPDRARLVEETAEDAYFMGGPDLQDHGSADDFGGIDDSAKHTAVLTIRRAGGTAMRLELVVDGLKSLTAEVTGAVHTHFDELGFAGSNSACDFVIDNIEVTSEAGRQGPSVKGRCEPCIIEVGAPTTLTAEAPGPVHEPLTYAWTSPTGRFEDPTGRRTTWTAPRRRGWSEDRWRKEGDVPVPITVTVAGGRGGTASHTVGVRVIRPDAR